MIIAEIISDALPLLPVIPVITLKTSEKTARKRQIAIISICLIYIPRLKLFRAKKVEKKHSIVIAEV
ncbi:MAG: hypothetical protein IJ703_11475 [Eubacterium sp.]|nr:hypothetical protein [Eubacterium sp.]